MSLLSTNVQIERTDGTRIDVVPRGASVLGGGTAEKVKQAIEKLFLHMRHRLERVKATYEKKQGAGSWTGPDPARLNLALLGDQCLLISDTCNTARLTRSLLEGAIAEAVKRRATAATSGRR